MQVPCVRVQSLPTLCFWQADDVGSTQKTDLIIHTPQKELGLYKLLDLPVHQTDGQHHFVFDTSQLMAALASEYEDMSLREMSRAILKGSGEAIVGFGNSGNDAVFNLETFLTRRSFIIHLSF